jgi:hypothetical protein
MLSIVATIALVLAILIAAVLAYASTRPSSFRIARSARIRSTPDRLFPLINNLQAMNTWNPYALRDPNTKAGYRGPASGKGAVHTFQGTKSGAGEIEIIDATAPREVTMRLTMVKPMRADNTVRFTLEPEGDVTTVTWAMHGQSPLLGKVMSLLIDCDKMVGKDFEQGLANLKAIAETSGPARREERAYP